MAKNWHNPNCLAFSGPLATCRPDCGYWERDGKTRAQRIAEQEKLVGVPYLGQET